MTVILVWNIENFAVNKIADPSDRRAPRTQNLAGDGSLTKAVASAQRLTLIDSVLQETNPDILVVVEVSTGDGGVRGAEALLTKLRERDVQWRLVPMLPVGLEGRQECVGIFFKGISGAGATLVNRYFTGPNVWAGGMNGPSQSGGAGGDYPGDFAIYMTPPGVPPRLIPNLPAQVQYRANQPENRSAARVEFDTTVSRYAGARRRIVALDFNGFREPCMVSFYEQHADGSWRNLTLFAVHAPPNSNQAVNYIKNKLAAANDINAAPNPAFREIKIVCGDFNVNALRADGNAAAVYGALTANGYVSLITPVANPAPLNGVALEAYKSYYGTLIGPRPGTNKNPITQGSRFLWADTATPIESPYPGYQYINTAAGGNAYALDNILVKRTDVVAPASYRFTIINPVVGASYNLINPAANGAPMGYAASPQKFTNFALLPGPVPQWPTSPAPGFNMGLARSLIGWRNYGRIRSTSDHLALYAEI
jgi:hypothetical protein